MAPKPSDGSGAEEYLTALQTQLDRTIDRNEALTRRVEKLERERTQLRAKLQVARSPITRRIAARLKRSGDVPETAVVGAAAKPLDVMVPGFGTLIDTPLPAEPPARPDLRVATILDGFSAAAFRYEFDCLELTHSGWRDQLEIGDPALLFVESAYLGVDKSWSTRIARFGTPHPTLVEVVEWFRSRGRPTVFWNKEDPINYDWFIASASLFDHVFTVDSNSLPRYGVDLGHERVGVLPFAAQPRISHPPLEPGLRTGSVAFAGSYYAAKHQERQHQMGYILDPAIEFGLDIFDRMAPGGDPRFAWPDRFRAHIVGSLTFSQTLEAYRRYRCFLNVNTVVDSPTMCARRVFELLASGTRVVSGPSLAIERMVPPGIVAVSHDSEETRSALRVALETDDDAPQRGIEWVRDGHTYHHRVEDILARVM